MFILQLNLYNQTGLHFQGHKHDCTFSVNNYYQSYFFLQKDIYILILLCNLLLSFVFNAYIIKNTNKGKY